MGNRSSLPARMVALDCASAGGMAAIAVERPPAYRPGTPRLLDRVRTAMRKRHMSRRSEQAYVFSALYRHRAEGGGRMAGPPEIDGGAVLSRGGHQRLRPKTNDRPRTCPPADARAARINGEAGGAKGNRQVGLLIVMHLNPGEPADE